MTEFKSGVDLSLMEGVLRQYQELFPLAAHGDVSDHAL